MSTILFDKIVFGPIHSRRLGISLGIEPASYRRETLFIQLHLL